MLRRETRVSRSLEGRQQNEFCWSHDLEGREDLTPWLGGVFVGSQFRRRGIGEALCVTVEEAAKSRGIQTLYLFTLDKQAWYSRQGWTLLAPCVWHERPGDIMSKHLQGA